MEIMPFNFFNDFINNIDKISYIPFNSTILLQNIYLQNESCTCPKVYCHNVHIIPEQNGCKLLSYSLIQVCTCRWEEWEGVQ